MKLEMNIPMQQLPGCLGAALLWAHENGYYGCKENRPDAPWVLKHDENFGAFVLVDNGWHHVKHDPETGQQWLERRDASGKLDARDFPAPSKIEGACWITSGGNEAGWRRADHYNRIDVWASGRRHGIPWGAMRPVVDLVWRNNDFFAPKYVTERPDASPTSAGLDPPETVQELEERFRVIQ